MGRKKSDVEVSVNGKQLTGKIASMLLGEDEKDPNVNIIIAQLKDGICNYGFEIIEGVGIGAKHNVKGPGIVKDSLRDAFVAFHVHMAVIDDAFRTKGIEITNIDLEHGNELTGSYHVTGFKISGSADNEKIELTGNKYVSSAGGRMELKTPKIPLDNLSSYPWYNELKAVADHARREVEKYNNGNYDPIEVIDEEVPNSKQMTIMDQGNDKAGQDEDSFPFAENEL